ncbi:MULTISPECIES: pentapeptide repeat-containing protein [unclassified Shewanella]|uniref:pentapeptide repeat-containing protein n=1 Tax=unclassified Shewanella TaxID=196818 RepID=UPI000C81C24D|nr:MULTISPECIES: pentapeptide repeat-containing protein [unclassified Shewanella]MDO6638485.1 pentapeptide repeat-containing protein [Shewanella sp. 5_MG-2023]MDO6677346.1 pentapeptide repeat-containing protein [Shewanella sp. 4_MG-2023]PMH87211.1 hypothetical protein BCU57_07825 [Shewanella sp. 10N.286.48.B5]PMI00402.1 hypothetical protein BCU55_11625 [Shewanella sp. 10N.286.48.A6]
MSQIVTHEQYFDKSFNKQPIDSTEGCEFEECEFNDCDFTEAVLKNTKFLSCTFNRCNLSLIKVPHSRFYEVDFNDCKMVGIDWTKADWPSFHRDAQLSFSRCILNDNSFFGLVLNELKLIECKLHDVDFRNGDFANSTMTFCDFTNSIFMKTNLQAVDFSDSTDFTIDVLQNRIAQAKFSRFEALNLLESLAIELVD